MGYGDLGSWTFLEDNLDISGYRVKIWQICPQYPQSSTICSLGWSLSALYKHIMTLWCFVNLYLDLFDEILNLDNFGLKLGFRTTLVFYKLCFEHTNPFYSVSFNLKITPGSGLTYVLNFVWSKLLWYVRGTKVHLYIRLTGLFITENTMHV